MAILQPNDLRAHARSRLEATSANPRQLVLIHTGLVVLLNLIISGLNLYLSQQIDSTGGLDGLGMRSVLQTVQTVLGYFSGLFTPFWSAGFLYAMISITRGQGASPKSLLRGFSRFGGVMGYVLWQSMLFMLICFALVYVVCFVYLMTPLAQGFLELLLPLMENPEFLLSDGTINMELLPMAQLAGSLMPMLVIYGIVLIAVYGWLSYHLRLTTFLMVEGQRHGALAAMVISWRMMKGHKWQMFKLDLTFWWYYLLEGLLGIVLYLDVLLPMMGIPLPVDPTVAFFLTLILYGVLELALHLWKKVEIDATYATAYDTIFRQFTAQMPK